MAAPVLTPYRAPVMPRDVTPTLVRKELSNVERSSRSIYDVLTNLDQLVNAANDAAAATAGVEVGHLYRNGSVLMARIT